MKCSYPIADIIVYSFSFQPIDSRMYIIIKNQTALVIDPFVCEEAYSLLREENVKKINILLTHEHYDHISGVVDMYNQFDCDVFAIEQCAVNLTNPKKNAASHFDILVQLAYGVEIENFDNQYTCFATKIYQSGFKLEWEGYIIKFIHSPGHSEGSVCIIFDDKYLFSGDSLIKGKKVITRLPGGNKKDYETITLPFLKSLSDEMIVFPGHGELGTLKELLNNDIV